VSETVIIQSAKNALAKKAPFLKKNSFADAVIMFSFLEYVTANNIEDSLFVSYNTDDFCEKKDGKKLLHPDLVPEFTSAKATFYHIVGEALQTIKEDIISKEELELIRDLQDEDEGKSERCVVCEQNDRYSLVYFGETELLDERTFKNIHPKISQQNSLDLGEEFEPTFENALTSIWTGRCDYCNTEHFLCAKCGSLNEILDQEYNERKACEGCGLDYLIEVEDDEIGMPIETSYSILKPIKQCRYCGDEYDEDEFQQDEDICNDCLKELNEK
jgi:hypothetical protein